MVRSEGTSGDLRGPQGRSAMVRSEKSASAPCETNWPQGEEKAFFAKRNAPAGASGRITKQTAGFLFETDLLCFAVTAASGIQNGAGAC
jgi:hypothetical protein